MVSLVNWLNTGKAEALFSASHVKCTCYAHQVMTASLHVLEHTGYIKIILCTTLEEAEVHNTRFYSAWCSGEAHAATSSVLLATGHCYGIGVTAEDV